jgi:DNA/RNA endonuclease YhcR with UshA esterase domain
VNQLEWVEAQSVTGLGIGRADTLDVGANDINNLVWPSRLVRIWDVMIDSVTGAAAQNVWARGNMELGGITFRMYLNAGTGLNGDSVFHLHRAYTVTGILTRHNTTYELKPRMATDVQPGLLPLTSIGIARDLTPDSMWVSVAGVVSAGTDVFGPQQFYLQDATAGIRVYLPVDTFPDGLPTVAAGDSVRIQGARLTYNDEAEIMASYVSVEGYSGPVVPYGISAGEINAGASQGELHTVFEVVVDSITGPYSQYVWVRDVGAGEVLQVYIDGDIGIAGPDAFTVGEYYDITGVVARYLSTFQLLPRGPEDIAHIIMPTPVADARAAATGTELAVTGVLTAGVSEFDADVMYVQDGTAGIALYFPPADYPTVPALVIGDSVRVTGFRSELNGEPRIDVYQTASYGGGFPVDTLTVAAADIDGGLYPGRLVRITNKMAIQVQGGTAFWVTEPNGGYDAVWVEVGTAAMSAGVMGVGGMYDLVGVVGNSNGTNVLRPRFDGDVAVLDAPGSLWLSFLNIPTVVLDSVQYNITAGGVTQPQVKLGADLPRRFASMKVSQGTSSAWAWLGIYGFDGILHRSLDKGEFLDTTPNVDVVACLWIDCTVSTGGMQDQYVRNEVQAEMEMYGIYPTMEESGDNDSFASADFLNWTLKDVPGGHIYYAHAGQVDETSDASDFYTFYVAQGDVVTIEILAARVNADGNLDSFLKLYDPAGSPLATDDDGTGTLDSMIQFTASESGNYFIEVTEYGGAGVYNLRIQKDF